MKCQQKINGKQCGANAMRDNHFCYHHNPKITPEEKLNSQTKGGKNRRQKVDKPLSQTKIKNAVDITALLSDTINRVRTGEMDCRVANTIGYLSNVSLKAYETSGLEERLKKLELMIKE